MSLIYLFVIQFSSIWFIIEFASAKNDDQQDFWHVLIAYYQSQIGREPHSLVVLENVVKGSINHNCKWYILNYFIQICCNLSSFSISLVTLCYHFSLSRYFSPISNFASILFWSFDFRKLNFLCNQWLWWFSIEAKVQKLPGLLRMITKLIIQK